MLPLLTFQLADKMLDVTFAWENVNAGSSSMHEDPVVGIKKNKI